MDVTDTNTVIRGAKHLLKMFPDRGWSFSGLNTHSR